jgi:hypothetical protein
MKNRCLLLLFALASFGCEYDGSRWTSGRSDVVPIPRIADADPDTRHSVTVRVPTRLHIERTLESLSVGFGGLQTTNLTVGAKMSTGIECVGHIYRDGRVLPLDGFSLRAGLDFEPYAYIFTRSRNEVPIPGEEYLLEFRYTLFETDVPAQQFWSRGKGRHYRILWSQTFKERIR